MLSEVSAAPTEGVGRKRETLQTTSHAVDPEKLPSGAPKEEFLKKRWKMSLNCFRYHFVLELLKKTV